METRPPTRRTTGYVQSIVQKSQQVGQRLWETKRYNIQTFRLQPLSEISGSFGDIGTLLPILIALTEIKAISVSSTLVFLRSSKHTNWLAFRDSLACAAHESYRRCGIGSKFHQSGNSLCGSLRSRVDWIPEYYGTDTLVHQNHTHPSDQGYPSGHRSIPHNISRQSLPPHLPFPV